MRSRYPAFIPLTLSTSVAFQFRTCRAVSLNNFRRSQERRSRWKFHRWGESSGFKIPPSSRLPYFSYVYSTIWQASIDPLPPPPNAWPESTPSAPSSNGWEKNRWIIYIFPVGEVQKLILMGLISRVIFKLCFRLEAKVGEQVFRDIRFNLEMQRV